MVPQVAVADRPDQRRKAREILARWRWLAYLVLLTFVLVLVESTRATRPTVSGVPSQHATANPR
jgi:hypothetical protein